MRRLAILLILAAPVAADELVRIPPTSTVANLPTCGASRDGLIRSVTDATSATDCTTGGGSSTALCQCDGSAWGSVRDGSGHSNGANCSAGNAPLGVGENGAVEGCFDVATQAELDALSSDSLTDADGDTLVQVEEGADDDTFRVDLRGVEMMALFPDAASDAAVSDTFISGADALAAAVTNRDGGSIVFTPGANATGGGSDGTVIVRQPGGVAGTDEVQIYHDGTDGIIGIPSSLWKFDGSSAFFRSTQSSGPSIRYSSVSHSGIAFMPHSNDTDSGFTGGGNNELSMRTGGQSRLYVLSDGSFLLRPDGANNALYVSDDGTSHQLLLEADSTQTLPLLSLEDSGGTEVFAVDTETGGGVLTVGTGGTSDAVSIVIDGGNSGQQKKLQFFDEGAEQARLIYSLDILSLETISGQADSIRIKPSQSTQAEFDGSADTVTFTPDGSTSALVVSTSGVDIEDQGTRPTCDSSTRGNLWMDEGGAGVADSFAVCAKDSSDVYGWRTIY